MRGRPLLVIDVRLRHETARTYNLEVDRWHTYFVTEGRVWVHNACANGGNGPQHGGPGHNQRIDKTADQMKKQGWGDIRKNQQQVDRHGNPVGTNRPDLSGNHPVTGERHNIEWDTKPSASAGHQARVNANDPDAVNTFIVIDPSGRPTGAVTRRP